METSKLRHGVNEATGGPGGEGGYCHIWAI